MLIFERGMTDSKEFIEVAKAADIPPGAMRLVRADDRMVVVYHTTDGFFASETRCPHRGGPLVEGDIIGNEIVCPWHLWGFDIQTGLCGGNPAISLTTHEVRTDGDRVLVRLSPIPEMTTSYP